MLVDWPNFISIYRCCLHRIWLRTLRVWKKQLHFFLGIQEPAENGFYTGAEMPCLILDTTCDTLTQRLIFYKIIESVRNGRRLGDCETCSHALTRCHHIHLAGGQRVGIVLGITSSDGTPSRLPLQWRHRSKILGVYVEKWDPGPWNWCAAFSI